MVPVVVQGDPDTFDMYIRACWQPPGSSKTEVLGTIVRLYDPPDIAVVVPPPAGGGGGGGGAVNANIGDYCSFQSCGPGSPPAPGPGDASWEQGFVNTSDNAPGDVDRCLWDFGDGTTQTTHCNYGDFFVHTYPEDSAYDTDNTIPKKVYTARLTVWLTDGSEDTTQQTYNLPYRYPW